MCLVKVMRSMTSADRGGAGFQWVGERTVIAIMKMKGEARANRGQTEPVTVMTGKGCIHEETGRGVAMN